MKFQRHNIFKKESSLNSGLFHSRRFQSAALGRFSGVAYRHIVPELITQEHKWVVVVNPRNQRSLLEACDDCGIVKSENSITRNCRAAPGQNLISSVRLII